MYVVFIDVRPDYHLIVRQVFFGKLPGDLERLLRCHLAGTEGLNNMVILDTARFAKVLFGVEHLLILPVRFTVEPCRQNLALSFITIENIVDPNIQPPFPRQNFCDCHYCSTSCFSSS